MIPILYDKNETAFTSNGLGRLSDCIRCIVTEQRNGVYECEFEYPVNGNHFDDITVGRIIACTHDDYGDVQPFDIYSKSEPINGVVTFNAHHISYRLNEITVKPFEAGTVALALQNIKNYSVTTNPFTFWTDRSSSAQFVNAVPRKARNMLGGEENSILDVFGTGEYEFDKFTVRFYAHRGQDTNISIRYAKNLTNFENDYDIQDSYTAVVPFWKGQNDQSEDVLVTLSEWYILSGHTVDSGRVVCVPMDLSTEFDTPPTEAQLRTKAQNRLSASDAWNPNQTVKINFVQLWQTEEYKDYAPLQRVRLCDTVGVFVPMYNMSLRAKVISVTYNVLLDRYDSMTLGDKPTTYAHVIEKQYDSKVAGIIDGFAALSSSISGVEQALVDLQDDLEEQIDAKIETWAQTSNPASSWTTSELRAQHNNDLWLYTGTSNITVGSVTIKPQGVYKYNGTNNTWVAYSSTSSNLFDLVDGKSTIFYGSPSGTYANKRTGDYLVDASTGKTYRWSGSAWVVQTDYQTAIANATATIQDDIEDAIEDATDLILGGTGGYVITTVNANGQPIELLITDNMDINQAQNVWRWNQGGFGHSKTGYNGTYTTAITQDGHIVADFIDVGTLTANLIRAGVMTSITGQTYFDLDNNKLVIAQDGPKKGRDYTQTGYPLVNINTEITSTLGEMTYYTKTNPSGSRYENTGIGFGIRSKGVNTDDSMLFLPYTGDYTRGSYQGSGDTKFRSKMALIATHEEFEIIAGADSFAKGRIGSLTFYHNGAEMSTMSRTASNGISLSGDNKILINYTGTSGSDQPLSITSAVGTSASSATFKGYLVCNGGKSRLMETENYGQRLLYCYETPSALFGDIGQGVTDENGVCVVDINDIFNETVDTNIEYNVFLQKEGQGDVWIDEKMYNYFVVKGTPNLKFSWELKARQKDIKLDYMEEYNVFNDRFNYTESEVYSALEVTESEYENYIHEQEGVLTA